MISPFKAALGVDYRAFEDRLEAAIHMRFGLPARTPAPIKKLIKQADRACAFFEATQLAGFSHEESLAFFDPPPAGYSLTIDPLPPAAAQARYLQRYVVLSEAAGYKSASDAAFNASTNFWWSSSTLVSNVIFSLSAAAFSVARYFVYPFVILSAHFLTDFFEPRSTATCPA